MTMMRKLFSLDPGFVPTQGEVVIVGTGRMALLAHTCLLQEGVAVAAFCDPSGSHVGDAIMGHPVISPDELRASHATAQVVWAGEDPSRAELELEGLGISDAWVDLRSYDIVNDAVWTFM